MAFALSVNAAVAEGSETLARQWCSTCHLFPDPSLLDRETWATRVLPDMGARLGMLVTNGEPFRASPNVPRHVYSQTPEMSPADWDSIQQYYTRNAPVALPEAGGAHPLPSDLFDIEVPSGVWSDFPTTTAILIDGHRQTLLIADAFDLEIESYSADLKQTATIRPGGVVSRIVPDADGYLALTMGANIGQTEALFGGVVRLGDAGLERLVQGLHRPVHLQSGEEGRIIVAEFGTHHGAISVHFPGQAAAMTLYEGAGASAVAVHQGDLYALFAQGDEKVVVWRDFDGEWALPETLLRFPPSYGVTGLIVADVTADGLADLVVTAGDNADLSPIWKPYHGIYLFEGRPGGDFVQSEFWPMDGAYGASVRDIDGDGDADIAAVSYFPDTARSLDQSAFVYIEQTETGYQRHYIPGLGQLGRFVAIASGDLDGDGDIDVALANMAFGPYGPLEVPKQQQAEWLAGPPFVVLRNRGLQH